MSYPREPEVKRPHREGCNGVLYRADQYQSTSYVLTDSIGRIGNGGIIAYRYVCNQHWAGCDALVLVSEGSCRHLAAVAVGEMPS